MRTLLRVGVAMLSLVLGVGAAFLAAQSVGPSGAAEVALTDGTSVQLLAFVGTLALVGGVVLAIGLRYVERSFQRARRRSRRRNGIQS
jgi:hypothetical protein